MQLPSGNCNSRTSAACDFRGVTAPYLGHVVGQRTNMHPTRTASRLSSMVLLFQFLLPVPTFRHGLVRRSSGQGHVTGRTHLLLISSTIRDPSTHLSIDSLKLRSSAIQCVMSNGLSSNVLPLQLLFRAAFTDLGLLVMQLCATIW